MKIINLERTVYSLSEEYPEVIDIMVELGFKEIASPTARNTVGRVMTIPAGAKIKNIDIDTVIAKFKEHGFEIEGSVEVEAGSESVSVSTEDVPETSSQETATQSFSEKDLSGRQEMLQDYLTRLNEGEELESVRADFVENFESVDATEIIEAEHALMAKGTPIEEILKLCDLHSALFHGYTCTERTAEGIGSNFSTLGAEEIHDLEDGHPVSIFLDKNIKHERIISNLRVALDKDVLEFSKLLDYLRPLIEHYKSKGDLLYPILEREYQMMGPAVVMWGVDIEMRQEAKRITFLEDRNEQKTATEALLTRMQEMLYKEDNILYPLCLNNFSEEEWYLIHDDLTRYFEDTPAWTAAEEFINAQNADKLAQIINGNSEDKYIDLASGRMTLEQLQALLNTLPFEITFIDEDNIHRYFNEGDGEKFFKRPRVSLNQEIRYSHPRKVYPRVEALINAFKSGVKDSFGMWSEDYGKTIYTYFVAVRNGDEFLGTIEIVQDMTFAKEYFEKQNSGE